MCQAAVQEVTRALALAQAELLLRAPQAEVLLRAPQLPGAAVEEATRAFALALAAMLLRALRLPAAALQKATWASALAEGEALCQRALQGQSRRALQQRQRALQLPGAALPPASGDGFALHPLPSVCTSCRQGVGASPLHWPSIPARSDNTRRETHRECTAVRPSPGAIP